FIQILNLFHRLDLRGYQQSLRSRIADPVDVRQRDVHMLVPWKIDACNTCHVFSLMLLLIGLQPGLALVPIWKIYPCRCLCFEFSQITRTTPLRCTILHLSQIFLTDALTFINFPCELACYYREVANFKFEI